MQNRNFQLPMALKLLVMILLIFTSKISFAGGWTTGGGELFGLNQNPWFIQNTPVVHYCVDLDPKTMGVSEDQVIPLIVDAFNFWKYQFALSTAQSSLVKLATQKFILDRNCNPSSDIRFQFGKLSRDQALRLKDPSRYLGISVRTNYDEVNLRGRGFVYFSPELGNLAMNSPYALLKPWSSTSALALYPILIHEVGHIMGLGHDSSFIMSEKFAENFLITISTEKSFATAMIQALFINHIPDFVEFTETNPIANKFCVRVTSDQSMTVYQNLFERFFGIPALSGQCSYAFIANASELKVAVSNDGVHEIIIGSSHLKKLKNSTNKRTIVRVQLPLAQKVFSQESGTIDAAYAETSAYFEGAYVSDDGKISRQIGVEVAPWGNPRITGVLDGKLLMNLDAEE